MIDTGDAMPIKQRPYRTSPECKREIGRQVREMLQKGIIQESVSPWSSPVVLVKKKDGSLRYCVYFRKVNQITRKDSFPMPYTLDVLCGYSVLYNSRLKIRLFRDSSFALSISVCLLADHLNSEFDAIPQTNDISTRFLAINVRRNTFRFS